MKPSQQPAQVLTFPMRANATPSTQHAERRRRAARRHNADRSLFEVPGFLTAASVVRELRADIPLRAIIAASRAKAPPWMGFMDTATIVAEAEAAIIKGEMAQ